MADVKPDISNLWQIEALAIENDNELVDYDYIEEYIDPYDDPDQADTVVGTEERESKHTVQLNSVRIINGEVENSVWSSTPTEVDEERKIAQAKSGPLGLAKAAKSASECLSLFLDADVIATIAEYTNERIKVEKHNYTRERDANETDGMEILSFLGILYLAGTVRDGRQQIEYLFEAKNGTGMEAVFLTMGLHRFHFLSRCVQFDDPTTAEEDTEADKLAPIRAVYERIVGNFQKFFRPGRLLALDEQLIPFKGTCEFRQCIPLKPYNSGLRFNLLVDCDVPYTSHMEVCVPNNNKPYDLSYAPADVAMRMTEPIQGKYKTVIMGPKFTSLETVQKLHDSRTMVIGEVKKSQEDIPKLFTVSKGRTENDTLVAYHEMVTLMSHMVRSKDLLILMSSHREENTDTEYPEDITGQMHDPKIVQMYNRSKNVVQLIQQMCSMYDVARASRRWQLVVFFNLMNLSAINAWCIYRMNHPEREVSRRDFLTDMALELLRPQARRRLDMKTIPRLLKQRIGIFLGLEKGEYDAVPVMPRRKGMRGRCYMCGRTRNKTTRNSCEFCGKFICSDHYACVCLVCYNGDGAETY
uniref:PiggyBac transposable element-derived protein domain-containing protein n=1 Tax=Anopheles atroparvus TaxID=41427 RepID=A0A182JHW7_ANOAO